MWFYVAKNKQNNCASYSKKDVRATPLKTNTNSLCILLRYHSYAAKIHIQNQCFYNNPHAMLITKNYTFSRYTGCPIYILKMAIVLLCYYVVLCGLKTNKGLTQTSTLHFFILCYISQTVISTIYPTIRSKCAATKYHFEVSAPSDFRQGISAFRQVRHATQQH